MIYTHMNVDLDSAAAVWAARRFIVGYESKVNFVSLNWEAKEFKTDADVAINIDANGQGIIKSDDISAFAKILHNFASAKEVKALRHVILFINLFNKANNDAVRTLADNSDSVKTLECNSLVAVFNAVKTILKDDEELVDYMSTIFEGLLQTGLQRDEFELVGSKNRTVLNLGHACRDLQEAGVIPKISFPSNFKQYSPKTLDDTSGVFFYAKNFDHYINHIVFDILKR